ncbi:MAG: cell division protein FtsL [Pseudomonadota bacterium]
MSARPASALTNALLWVALLATALGNVYARHEANQKFGELRRLEAVGDELGIEWNGLRLSESYLARYDLVEQTARVELDMVMPHPSDVAVIKP